MKDYTNKRLQYALYQINKAIRTHGDIYTFISQGINEFGEPTDEELEIEIPCLWHTTNSFISESISEATKIHSKQQPQLLCDYSKAKKITNETFLNNNGVKYKVIDVIDIGNFGVVGDICLEVIK